MAKNRKNSLEKQAQKQQKISKLTWMKIQATRLLVDRGGLFNDISKWIATHHKEIKRMTIKLAIVMLVAIAAGFFLESIFSSVVVYKNGVPVYGPGAP